MITFDKSLSFDDITLIPRFSDLESRTPIDSPNIASRPSLTLVFVRRVGIVHGLALQRARRHVGQYITPPVPRE
jgi:hypothetical protein